jgi:GDSL-like Lipase/Acylhydrolase family
VFLGDSLTEGVGSQRISHVTELVRRLRDDEGKNGQHRAIHHMRLRSVNPNEFDRFVKFNVAGFLDADQEKRPAALWIWNLGCEGRTIESDESWFPFLTNLKPELVIVFRGGLESIIRPAMLKDGAWPWWVPDGWHGYATLDPRCYFSSTWWRNAKQVMLDNIKQRVRLRLLDLRPGKPLMHAKALISHYGRLLSQLQQLGTRVLVLGLLPVDDTRFPGSFKYFGQVNAELEELAKSLGVEFVDWGQELDSADVFQELFYRDGFHPNAEGARALAAILLPHLRKQSNCPSLK